MAEQQQPAKMWSGRFRESLARAIASACLGMTLTLTACHSKPDRVVTLRSPSSAVYYTVESDEGHGAISSDFTRIYGHYDHGGNSDRQLALSGPYLDKTTARWNTPLDVDFCIGHGRTFEFRNLLFLSTKDGSSLEIHQRINESC